MKGKQRLYIAYGSNLNLEQMAFRCPTAKVVGKSELKDYELLFRGGRRGAVATVEPKEGSTVPVLIWEIQNRDEVSLDLYEGYPNLYGKQMLEVELDGKTVPAMVYVMTPGHSFGIPSDYYSNVIWQGYETAGFETQVSGGRNRTCLSACTETGKRGRLLSAEPVSYGGAMME